MEKEKLITELNVPGVLPAEGTSLYKYKSDQVLALLNFTTPILVISENLSRAHVLLTS